MKKTLVILFVLPCILMGCFKKQAGQSGAEVKPVYVKFEPAALHAMTQNFETAGELKADKEILVAAERPGKIDEIYVREGLWVDIGADLVKIQGDDVDADLAKAKSDFSSYKQLYEQGAISKQELLNYETSLKKIQSQKDNLFIKATSSGIVGAIYVDPGDYVSLGNPIMDLVKIYPLRVSFTIPERLITKIVVGQTVLLSSDASPGKEYISKVDFISPRVDPQTRTVLVRAILSNPDKFLKANQYVRVKAVISDDKVLAVREGAVYLDQGQEFLYIAVPMKDIDARIGKKDLQGNPLPTHTAQRFPITTGLREPGKVQILEGIQAGDNVIYAGLHSIYPGAQLIKVEEDNQ